MNRLFLFLIISIPLYFACEETTGPTGSSAPFIPSIENTWIDEADSNHTVFLTTDDVNLAVGLVNGNEFHPDLDPHESKLCGMFNERNIEFDIFRENGTIRYKGSFTTENRIELTSVEGDLVIIRPVF